METRILRASTLARHKYLRQHLSDHQILQEQVAETVMSAWRASVKGVRDLINKLSPHNQALFVMPSLFVEITTTSNEIELTFDSRLLRKEQTERLGVTGVISFEYAVR